MPVITDIHGHTWPTEPLRIMREVFDTSYDAFERIQAEEQVIQIRAKRWEAVRNIFHFILLTSIIFVILLLLSNWPAYSAYARAILLPDELISEKKSMETSIGTTEMHGRRTLEDLRAERRKRAMLRDLSAMPTSALEIGAKYFDTDVSKIPLNVTIAPYENRIIIPRINKNIPLVNVEHYDATNSTEWHKIFMKELENGIIKYPGSADPGEPWNSFIFWHSSNYPWAKGNYNDVFALLNELQIGDEIIVYFQQKKFIYVVKDKMIVKPGHVSSLSGDSTMRQMTLMTCWPLGTTLNRLLVVTELKNP